MSERGFFALEGLDGVGKSSVINALEEKGHMITKTPPEELDRFRPDFEDARLPARFLYFLGGVQVAGKQIEDQKGEQHIFSDRYLLTTVAAHESMGLDEEFIGALTPIIDDVARPDVTILLTAREDVRIERMYSRVGGANENDLSNNEINDAILEGYRKWSEKLGYELIEVDTSDLTLEETVEVIESIANGGFRENI